MTDIPPPTKLFRTLSEHHWQAATALVAGNDENTVIDAGTSYDIEDGSVVWKYYVVKRENIVEKHTISDRYNIHHVTTSTLEDFVE